MDLPTPKEIRQQTFTDTIIDVHGGVTGNNAKSKCFPSNACSDVFVFCLFVFYLVKGEIEFA